MREMTGDAGEGNARQVKGVKKMTDDAGEGKRKASEGGEENDR